MSFTRELKDAQLIATLTLPAAGATANSTPLDLGIGGAVELSIARMSVPALAALADTKTVTLKLQHSDTTTSGDFVDLPSVGALVVTGVSTNGSSAAVLDLRLPSNVKRYLRLVATAVSASGDVTAQSATLSLQF